MMYVFNIVKKEGKCTCRYSISAASFCELHIMSRLINENSCLLDTKHRRRFEKKVQNERWLIYKLGRKYKMRSATAMHIHTRKEPNWVANLKSREDKDFMVLISTLVDVNCKLARRRECGSCQPYNENQQIHPNYYILRKSIN